MNAAALTPLLAAAVAFSAMPVLVWAATGGRPAPAVGLWCGGSALLGAGVVLVALRWPGVVLQVLADALVLAGPVLWRQSLARLPGAARRARGPGGLLAAVVLLAALASQLSEAVQAPVVRLALAVLLLRAAGPVRAMAPGLRGANAWMVRAGLAGMGLALAAWSLGGGFAPDAVGLAGSSWSGTAFAVVQMLAATAAHLGFIGLVLQQAAAEQAGALARSAELERRARLDARAHDLDQQRRATLLLGTLAHELNQPLAAGLAQAQLAQRRLRHMAVPDAATVGLLQSAESAMRHATAILARVQGQELPRPATGTARFDLGQVLADAMALMRPDWQQAGLEVRGLPPGGAPAIACRGDGVAACQVLVNLLRNATQAALAGGRLLLELGVQREAGGVLVRIRDHGPGVPAQVLGRLGEPVLAGAGPGLGIGLAISMAIARELGAELRLANCEGGGALAVLRLPLALESA